MKSIRKYKWPNCKHSISITIDEFVKGIAMASCGDCGRNGIAIEDILLNGKMGA